MFYTSIMQVVTSILALLLNVVNMDEK